MSTKEVGAKLSMVEERKQLEMETLLAPALISRTNWIELCLQLTSGNGEWEPRQPPSTVPAGNATCNHTVSISAGATSTRQGTRA